MRRVLPGRTGADRSGGAVTEPLDPQVARRYRLLVLGTATSSYGTFLNMVALTLFLYVSTGSALSMGAFAAVRLIAGVAGGMVSSTVLDRAGTKSVLLVTNTLPALALLALVLVPASWATPTVFVTAVVSGLCGSVSQVALRSAIPEIVGAAHRDWANSLMVTARSLAMVAGFASAGLVVSLLGYTAAFLIDAASFLACVAAIAALPIGRRTGLDGAPVDPDAGVTGRGAILALLAAPALALMVGLRAVDGLASSSHNVGLPVQSTALDPAQPAVFISVFWACWAVGNVAMQQVIRIRARRGLPSIGAVGFGIGTMVMSAAFILAFCGFPLPLAAAVALVAGGADGLTEVSYTSQLQQLPAALRTRAFGLTTSLESAGFGIGTVAVAAAMETIDPLPVVAVAHGLGIVVGAVFLIMVTVGGARLLPATMSEVR